MSQSECSNDEECWKLPEQEFLWDCASELALYQALITHKPAGINKHFAVALVAERLSDQLGKPVYTNSIWKKLRSLFDLAAVDDREEAIPFSLEAKEFSLPKREFESLILERQKDWREKSLSKHLTPTRTPSTPKSEGSVGSRRSSPILKDKEDMEDDDDEDTNREVPLELDDNDDSEIEFDHHRGDLDQRVAGGGDEPDTPSGADNADKKSVTEDNEELESETTDSLRAGGDGKASKSSKDTTTPTAAKNDKDKTAIASGMPTTSATTTRERTTSSTSNKDSASKPAKTEAVRDVKKSTAATPTINSSNSSNGNNSKEEDSKSVTKRHITRSTPNNTPSKRRKV